MLNQITGIARTKQVFTYIYLIILLLLALTLSLCHKPNLTIESGVNLFLHPNCHQQTVYGKFNSEIIYPSPYMWEVWYYKGAKIELIRRAINQFNWQRLFLNTSVSEKKFFHSTILNVLGNFIPHEVIICDDRYRPWLTKNKRINSCGKCIVLKLLK